MGLVERLEGESRSVTPGPECSVAVFLRSLDDLDREDFVESMSRLATIKTSVIQRAIKDDYELFVPMSSLQRHRNGQCKCGRRT